MMTKEIERMKKVRQREHKHRKREIVGDRR